MPPSIASPGSEPGHFAAAAKAARRLEQRHSHAIIVKCMKYLELRLLRVIYLAKVFPQVGLSRMPLRAQKQARRCKLEPLMETRLRSSRLLEQRTTGKTTLVDPVDSADKL